jgi:c-di-GMP-binding flagellar brake protein YcgR
MMNDELREKYRVPSQNLVYLCVKENDETVLQGMGKTLNISESGIQLETGFAIDAKKIITLSIGVEEDIVEIQGKIIYSAEKDGKYEFGIGFLDVDERSRIIINQYVRLFQ